MPRKQPVCPWCGAAFTPEEVENPRRDGAGSNICDECYHDHYEFTCCRCQNYEHTDHEGAVGQCFAVTDAEVAPVGIYRVLSCPLFGQPTIGAGHLYYAAMKQVRRSVKGIDTNGFPCGYLCRKCSRELDPPRRRKTGTAHAQ